MKKIINYSGIPALILMAALFFLPVSCDKVTVEENPDADNSSQLIKVSGEDANAATKTTLAGLVTSWNEGDKVGIYSTEARTALGGSTAIANAEFTAASSGVSSNFTGTMFWGTATATDHTFYAYYPYKAGDAASTAVPVSLASAQTQSAADNSDHIGALDFMVATPKTVGSPGGSDQISNTAVHLSYNHLFTVLEFQIKRSSGSGKITKVRLTAPTTNLSLTSGTVNITSATPGAGVSYTISSPSGTKEITLTITDGVTPTSDYATTPKIYMMILPGDFHTEDMTIGLNYENSNVSGTYVYENTTKTGKVFARGMKYVVQMDDTPASVTDVESNVYTTVRIGSQVWMASNLKTTHYNDGTPIPILTDYTGWATLITGACSLYNNVELNKPIYGALYNWYAVADSRKLCPTGWHVPTDDEWWILTSSLGGESVAGGPLKETGYSHWASPNTGATNGTGFTALPGGYCSVDGVFRDIGSTGNWWSSTSYSASDASARFLYNNLIMVFKSGDRKQAEFSVRCLKN